MIVASLCFSGEGDVEKIKGLDGLFGLSFG